VNTTKIMNEKWDYLIILDACRYDYFERLWRDYLPGRLEKRISAGTATKQWRNRNFPDYYEDVVYISANPYVNSLAPVKGFLGKEHFFKVYDLWLENWDNEKGTVLPEVVTQRAIEIINSHPDKQAIVHYIQPHEPYVGSTVSGPGFGQPNTGGILEGIESHKPPSPIIIKTRRLLLGILYHLGIRGNHLLWKLRELLHLPPANPMDAVRRKYGNEILRQAYKENLEIALKYVAELVDNLSGKIIVTADHGEMLGEDNCYCHWSRAKHPLLLEIPWLIIEKGKKGNRPPADKEDKRQIPDDADRATDEKTKKQIEEKLKALGYY